MSAIVAPIHAHPHAQSPSWGARDLDALDTLRPGALTLVRVEAHAGRDLLEAIARDALVFDAGGLVHGLTFELCALPDLLGAARASLVVVAGMTDAALEEDAGRALLLDALDAARACARRLDAPVVLVERARRLSAKHPLHGVVEAAADEVVALRRERVVELPRRGAQLKLEA